MELKELTTYIIFPVIAAVIAWVIIEALKRLKLLPRWVHFKRKEEAQVDASKELIPDFVHYTKDNIDGFIYKWGWVKLPNGWRINKIRACCPHDETPLIVESMFYIKCPRCKRGFYENMPDINNATIIIQDNVSKKYGATSV